ncbi:uncharacterized protein LOC131696538 isoform X1 [Acipenser ruthenus]|uniref:uncharacterized protein LOC117406485 isoform X1 n=1 Tax=Acipenser ruthenus TaxID=7906 RepID=UPI002740AD0B|nr:uncharacterized protein LOC117406485 isoform X1 [Acipenser ruthenus]XP_034778788.2 uncharacterized protein LOC117406485 isoform X1 [Acipenser ruthenus]XP_034778789.2 uncharacterized protein LOC117406485 isoform X1 [Acipenser ruthenus]XP_058886865.1 uncharacterized protein LOC131696538 isoform X1 [Acipenser ruthenus]XP_058886866.1 uncharacterized protein LOC131696538 isoform X1 [Acipenser ruthenus]XP_058886867.1 uncharacterized protein LOC131696538 isoform X1 [Acipenser ruthenus]XP_05888686
MLIAVISKQEAVILCVSHLKLKKCWQKKEFSCSSIPICKQNYKEEEHHEQNDIVHNPEVKNMLYPTCKLHVGLFLLIAFTDVGSCSPQSPPIIRASKGSNALLPCAVPANNHSRMIRVEWSRGERTSPFCKYTVESNTITQNECGSRMEVIWQSHHLKIKDLTIGDSSIYSCVAVSLIPPPIIENRSELTLLVEGMRLELFPMPSNTSPDCIQLVCSLASFYPPKVNVTWSKQGVTLSDTLLTNSSTYLWRSTLSLCKPDWNEGDVISCHVNSSVTAQPLTHNITITFDGDVQCCTPSWTTIIVTCVCLSAAIILGTSILLKCRKGTCLRSNEGTVLNNLVYENLQFSTAHEDHSKTSASSCIYDN